jgi:hypothetical protein
METKRRRKQELTQRKNYLPTMGIVLTLWIGVVSFIVFIDPNETGAVFIFFVLLFAALSFTFSILFGNTRRGVLLTTMITGYFALRILGLDTLFNGVVLVLALAAFEVYFSRKI